MIPGNWPPLHDATIESISVEWPGPKTTITIGIDEQIFEIIAIDTKNFSCPQRRPWGKSRDVFINTATLTSDSAGTQVLCLETQNGDEIRIDAAEISVRRRDA